MTYPIGDEVLDLRMQCAQDTDELARLRRNLQATHQALLDAQAELERCRPVAAAAHAYCASRVKHEPEPWDWTEEQMRLRHETHVALFAAHRATTPSATPPTHTVVAVSELERLRAAAGELGADGPGWAEDDARNAEMGL